MRKLLFFLIIPLSLCSCSISTNDKYLAYLNYKYTLVRAGDLHGLNPTSNEVLNRNPGFTSYMKYFDKQSSYINFQCVGTSLYDFKCETQFCLKDSSGKEIINLVNPVFYTTYSGGQSGTVNILDNSVKDLVGTIYVYTPYWCRWQCEYDVNDDGNPILITFEFWKSSYNPLPDFITNP